MNSILKKRDLILAAAILLAALILYAFGRYAHRAPAAYAEISVDGRIVARLDLDEDREYTVSGYGGGYNHIIVRDSQIWVDEASCPDKVCIRQGHIDSDGQTIICLPNRMVAEVRREDAR